MPGNFKTISVRLSSAERNFMKKMIILALLIATNFSITNFGMEVNQEQIVDFVYDRDAKDVLKIIQDDWNWLFTSDSPHYDPEHVLQYEIPNKDLLERKDSLKMKVLHQKDRVIGFVTFYKENSDLGRIRLVSVSQDFRKKGFDRKLTSAAVNELFTLGCTSVYLFTHKKNEKVPTYESLGFQEDVMPQDAIVWFKEHKISIEEYAQYARYSVNKKTFKQVAGVGSF